MHQARAHRKLIIAILLGVMAYLLMYIAFPLIPIAPFLTMDFSGVPVLLAFIFLKRKSGYLTILIKELLCLIFLGLSVDRLIGIGADVIALIILAEITMLFVRDYQENWQAIIFSTIGMTVGMASANYLMILPLYMKMLGMKLTIPLSKMVLIGVVPFNLIKGFLLGIVVWLLIPNLMPIFNKIDRNK